MSVTFTIVSEQFIGGRTVYVHGECDAEFNLSNANAALVLRAVGLIEEGEWYPCGSTDADTVLAACVAFRATGTVVAGRRPALYMGDGHATMYACGASPEYVAERVAWLESLAEQARAGGYAVGWA